MNCLSVLHLKTNHRTLTVAKDDRQTAWVLAKCGGRGFLNSIDLHSDLGRKPLPDASVLHLAEEEVGSGGHGENGNDVVNKGREELWIAAAIRGHHAPLGTGASNRRAPACSLQFVPVAAVVILHS